MTPTGEGGTTGFGGPAVMGSGPPRAGLNPGFKLKPEVGTLAADMNAAAVEGVGPEPPPRAAAPAPDKPPPRSPERDKPLDYNYHVYIAQKKGRDRDRDRETIARNRTAVGNSATYFGAFREESLDTEHHASDIASRTVADRYEAHQLYNGPPKTRDEAIARTVDVLSAAKHAVAADESRAETSGVFINLTDVDREIGFTYANAGTGGVYVWRAAERSVQCITRGQRENCLGGTSPTEDSIEDRYGYVALQPGDRIMVCTASINDDFRDDLDPGDISHALSLPSVEDASNMLAERSSAEGGKTVMVIEVAPERVRPPRPPGDRLVSRTRRGRFGRPLLRDQIRENRPRAGLVAMAGVALGGLVLSQVGDVRGSSDQANDGGEGVGDKITGLPGGAVDMFKNHPAEILTGVGVATFAAAVAAAVIGTKIHNRKRRAAPTRARLRWPAAAESGTTRTLSPEEPATVAEEAKKDRLRALHDESERLFAEDMRLRWQIDDRQDSSGLRLSDADIEVSRDRRTAIEQWRQNHETDLIEAARLVDDERRAEAAATPPPAEPRWPHEEYLAEGYEASHATPGYIPLAPTGWTRGVPAWRDVWEAYVAEQAAKKESSEAAFEPPPLFQQAAPPTPPPPDDAGSGRLNVKGKRPWER